MFRYHLFAAFLIVLAFFVQPFIGVLEAASLATLHLAPTLFFCVACTTTYAGMLGFAIFTGFLWDAVNLPWQMPETSLNLVDEMGLTLSHLSLTTNQLPFGYTILLFAVSGTIMQGVRPWFTKGRWGAPLLMVGIATFLWIFLEYLWITIIRQELFFPPPMWIKLVSNAFLGMLISPLVIYILHKLALYTGHTLRYEGLTIKRVHVY